MFGVLTKLPMALNLLTCSVLVYDIRMSKYHIELYFHATLQLHNSPGDCAKELFKPSKDSASPLVCNEKNVSFGFCFFVGDIISGIGFWPFWLRLPGNWAPTAKRKIFESSFHCKLGYNLRLLSF